MRSARCIAAVRALALLALLPVAAMASDARVVGKWRAASGAVFEFKPDGTGANARGGFRYAADHGVLTFACATGTLVMEYAILDGRLLVSSGGESATFTRAGSGAPIAARKPGIAGGRVAINGVRLTAPQIAALERRFQVRILDGSYWYDRACGAWGLTGGPTLGFIPAGLDVGGPLPADASGGHTGVFVNGRELHPFDVAGLQQITIVVPGRYWVDASGFCGNEGDPTPIVNLAALAQAARARTGTTYHTRSDITGIGSGGDGRTSYVMGKDWSVIIGE